MYLYLIGKKIDLIGITFFRNYTKKDHGVNELRASFPSPDNEHYFCFNNLEDAQECVARMRYTEYVNGESPDKSNGDLTRDFPLFCITVDDRLQLVPSKNLNFQRTHVLTSYNLAMYNTDVFNRYNRQQRRTDEILFYEIPANLSYHLTYIELGSKVYRPAESQSACLVL